MRDMEELKENSIHIKDTRIIWPDNREDVVNMSYIASNNDASFSIHNDVICYIIKGEAYVTPYTRRAFKIIIEAGLIRDWYYVPFSHGERPRDEQNKWAWLCRQAFEARYGDFELDCIRWSNEHCIAKLDPKTIERCFKIPRDGILVEQSFQTNRIIHPVNDEWYLDAKTADTIGKYNSYAGKVVFVYRDGCTYVTHGYWILYDLEESGFERADLFVPFASGERIIDRDMASAWAHAR